MKTKSAIAAIMLASSAAAAQDGAAPAETAAPAGPAQTVDGARRFLNLLAEDGHLEMQSWNKSGWMVSYKATSVDFAQCQSTFMGTPYGYPDQAGNFIYPNSTAWSEPAFYAVVAGREIPTAPYTLEWSKIAAISTYKPGQYDTERAVAISGSDKHLYLKLPTPELAKRVRYAVEFIKASCDRTAETGF